MTGSLRIIGGRREAPKGLAGGPEGTRTPDLADANRALSQLSYRPESEHSILLALAGSGQKQALAQKGLSAARV